MRIMSIKPGLESIAEVMRLNWRTINSLNRNLNGLIIQSRSLAAAISAQHFFSGAKHGRPPARLRPQWLRESHPLQGIKCICIANFVFVTVAVYSYCAGLLIVLQGPGRS